MKAITIQQPYSHLICLPDNDPEHKRVENRGRATDYRGPVAIHAGKGRDYLEPGDLERWPDMPFGAVEGVAELVACLPIEDIRDGLHDLEFPWLKTHKHTEGPWCLVLKDVRRLSAAVPCSGAQAVPFNLPSDVEILVKKQMVVLKIGAPLEWVDDEDGASAYNSARVFDSDESLAIFEVNKSDTGFVVASFNEALVPQPGPAVFGTMEAAKAWCEARNTELATVKPAEKVGSAGPALSTMPDAGHWTEIIKARESERKAEYRLSNAQAEVKAAKAELEAASERLGVLIDESSIPTLFTMPKVDASPATDETWRETTLESIGITGRAMGSLLSNDPSIATLGDLSAFQKQHGERWSDELKGFGPAAKAEVEKAWEDFWFAKDAKAQDVADEMDTAAPVVPSEPDNGLPAQLLNIGPDSSIALSHNEAGWWASYAVRIGKHTNDTGDNATGPHATEGDALAAAAGEIRGWLGRIGNKGLRGSGPGEVQAMVKALDALLTAASA